MTFVVHWNCRGLIHNLGDIKDIIHNFSPVAVCLQETNLGPKTNNFLRGFTIVRKDREHASRLSGGVAIVVQGATPTRDIKLNTRLEAVAVTVLSHKSISICSVYISPHEHVTLQDLEELTAQLPEPFLLVGDFNAHCTLWGSEKTDQRGQVIEDFILSTNICLLNSGSPTYFSPSTRKFTCIDLAFCSPSVFSDFTWDVLDTSYGSDHLPAVVKLSSTLPTLNSKPRRWKLQHADWPLFTQNAKLERMLTPEMSVDEMNEKVTEVLIAAAEKSIPQSSCIVRKKLNPWWTPECTQAKKHQNKAWAVLRRYPTYTNLINFKKAKARARYIRRQAEKSSWKDYVSSINSSVTSKKLWDCLRKFKGDYSSYALPLLTPSGIQTTLQEQADILGEHFYNISSSANYSDAFIKYKQSAEKQRLPIASSSNEPYNAPLTLQELNRVLSAGKKTAVGQDRIHYSMLAHLSPGSVKALLFFFNKIWDTGTIPKSWKNAIIVPFLKAGKPRTSATSYRPIALTSCLAKSYESVINARLTFTLETQNLLDIHQCGYKRNYSTIDNLVRLEHEIRNAFIHKQHCLTVFFDLEKAYDTAWRFGILRDLADLGIRGKMLKGIADFLSNRTFQVRLGTALSRVFTQENGVPQGCILSTTLFVVKMNSVNKAIPASIMHSLYVDDLQIACRGSNLATCERQVQIALNRLTKWATENGFRFSAEKTVAVVFSQKRGLYPDPVLKMHQCLLPVKQEHTFLGVTFDKKLNFLAHINSLKIKANKALNILKVLSRKRWGSDRKCILHIYRSLVRSKIEYGCVVYGSARQSYLRRLDAVHNLGIRLAIGAYRTSPVPSLYAESNEPSLEQRRIQVMVTYVLRVRSTPGHICHDIVTHCSTRTHYANKPHAVKPLILRYEEKCRDYNIPKEALHVADKPSRIAPWCDFTQFLDLSLTHVKKQDTPHEHIIQEFRLVQETYNTYVEFYTDGSKTHNYVGSSVVSGTWERTVRLPQLVSVFSAECYALWMALQQVLSAKHKKAVIYTDSLSALRAFNLRSEQKAFIGEILGALSRIDQNQSIRFCWVPSHTGILGNEKADQCAANARHQTTSKIKVPLRDGLQAIHKTLRHNWQCQWNTHENNKLHLIKPVLGEWKSCYHQERFIEVVLARLRIGHTHLTHNYLLKNEPQPKCNECQEPLTVLHFLITCPHVERARQKHFKDAYALYLPLHPTLILGDNPLVSITDVVNFLHELGILNKI